MRTFLLVFLLCYMLPTFTYSQSPYQTSWKKEWPYIGSGVSTLSLGFYLNARSKLFTGDELLALNPANINSFDRIAVSNFSKNADHVSDVFLYGSVVAPFLLLGGRESRSRFGQIMILYGEAFAINGGVTLISKSLFKRPRPYVFNEEVLTDFKLSKKARASFISGHTSVTALNSFFAAKVFSDFYPNSKWKPVVWTLAATIPAATGYLRVRAGKHFPTDVIAGYAVGAAIGILVPHFHRNKNKKSTNLHLDMGYNQARLVWQFNRCSH